MGGQRNSCGLGSCLCFFILAGVAATLAWYFTKGHGQLPPKLQNALNYIPTLGDFENEAPFVEETPNEVPRWPHSGYGLSMEIVNALEDDLWSTYFDQSVSDWNSGSPDVLNLTSSVAGYDADCTPIDGVIKVCNNDYGDTGWYGINEISAVGKQIVSSIAKMNDYYFTSDASDMTDRRQYTMCHEMGHSFGLPHVDESFNNADTGSCLDYTNRPQDNLHPNSLNWNFLNDLYGTGNATMETTAPSGNGDDDAVGPTTSNGQGRERQLVRQLPDWVHEEWIQVSAAATVRGNVPSHWRRLRSSSHGDVHEVELGEGYSIFVERLRPAWLH
ncbi:hypothetical protein MPSEU_000587900 [Mayamaea pseudoterrestris]|nr:hypothetical protein MPSEU_000587900 [Mayamaea pseudoterrestris]